MTLLVDAGNSAIKWGLLHGAQPSDGGRVLHRDGGDLAARLTAAWRALPGVERTIGCAVAGPAVVAAIERALAALALPPIAWLASQSRFEGGAVALVNGYRNPAQLGADRWHAMLGACAGHPAQSLVVVNAGTATTVDCVLAATPAARFVGGCIAPGVRLMLESLAHGTAGLPLADATAVDFPESTEQAITSGVHDAQAGLVERVCRRFCARFGTGAALLIGGGHAEALVAQLTPELAPTIEHNLVLRGLALRARAP